AGLRSSSVRRIVAGPRSAGLKSCRSRLAYFCRVAARAICYICCEQRILVRMASQMDIRTALRSPIYRSKTQELTNFWFELELAAHHKNDRFIRRVFTVRSYNPTTLESFRPADHQLRGGFVPQCSSTRHWR